VRLAQDWRKALAALFLLAPCALQAEPYGPPAPPTYRMPDAERPSRSSVVPWAAPVLAAIVADQITTQRVLALDGLQTPGYAPRRAWEQNRTPGMQSFGGRIAWNAAELGAITWGLHHKKPAIRKWAKIAAVASVLVHGYCSVHNARERSKALAFDRAHR